MFQGEKEYISKTKDMPLIPGNHSVEEADKIPQVVF